jgi:endonuclease/exonuclease/phosphatase family metal-dependent hydrolase
MAMRIKAVQFNLYKGKYFDEAVDFLKREEADIIFLQEITKGQINYYKDKNADLFELLRKKLGINGVLDKVQIFVEFPQDYFGNAVFSKFPIISSKSVILRDQGLLHYSFEEKGDSLSDRPFVSRHMIDALLDIKGAKIHAICAHGAWTAPPQDTEETLRQAGVIADYLKSLGDEPFILGGDLNTVPGSKVVDMISAVANNLMKDSGISQTTHPKVHKIAPKGFLVDYIFASRHFSRLSISASSDIIVSDHLPVVAELEFAT